VASEIHTELINRKWYDLPRYLMQKEMSCGRFCRSCAPFDGVSPDKRVQVLVDLRYAL
jgi:hypothetical protein